MEEKGLSLRAVPDFLFWTSENGMMMDRRATGEVAFDKAPQNFLSRACHNVSANIATPHFVQYVRTNFMESARQKFFAELFFKKATSPVAPLIHHHIP